MFTTACSHLVSKCWNESFCTSYYAGIVLPAQTARHAHTCNHGLLPLLQVLPLITPLLHILSGVSAFSIYDGNWLCPCYFDSFATLHGVAMYLVWFESSCNHSYVSEGIPVLTWVPKAVENASVIQFISGTCIVSSPISFPSVQVLYRSGFHTRSLRICKLSKSNVEHIP